MLQVRIKNNVRLTIEDSRYYFSFDGINCLENTIKHCHYAIQALKYDVKVNTIDPYFTQRNDWENIITTCGRCKYGYGVIMSANICLAMNVINCYFSYVEYMCDIIITDQIVDEIIKQNYYVTPDGQKITYAFDDDENYICTSFQYCIITPDYTRSD